MRITKIESQKKNPRRRNIYADGAFVAGVSDEALLRTGLRTGDEISDERLKALLQAEEETGAKHAALRFLAHRPRTRKEVRDKLREKEFGDKDIEKVLDNLTQAGLLNDMEFAKMYVRDALSAKPVGKNLLRQRLLLFGVDKATVDEVLQEAFSTVNDEAAAMEAGRKFLKKSLATRKASDKAQLRSRLAGFLNRRGFSWATIEPVMKTLIKEQEE
jgi:regulatory protein